MPLFGAHMSTAGGLYKAFERAHRVQAEALQIFTRNQRQWAVPPLGDEERAAFMAAHGEWGNRPLAAHGSYLINLANPRKEAVSRSIGALCEEISRCSRLHIPYLIIHPGAHMGSGGHAFAAGYDIRTRETYEKTFQEFDSLIGLERLRFFHLNDSKRELASRIDRHDHIGKGKIGTGGFSLLVNDARFKNHPMVLETPKGKDLAEDRRNLRLLRSLVGKNR
ncbi:MAG: hypothetical protein B1H13_08810 [Desulfobacteraceae bacterium 4484_190.3]|nr:MAG: hypothetical protein B1H13_08810 [Desulfobacteraceae bacterium 4484_190.3]